MIKLSALVLVSVMSGVSYAGELTPYTFGMKVVAPEMQSKGKVAISAPAGYSDKLFSVTLNGAEKLAVSSMGVTSISGTLTGNAATATTATNVAGGTASVTTLTASGAGNISGQFTWGAAATRSTGTTTGDLSMPGALVVGGAASAASLSASGNATVAGDSYFGAIATRSTHTAAGVLTVHAAVQAPEIKVPSTGMMFVGLRTLAQLAEATAVMGEIGICSDCTPVEVFISTGPGAPNTGGYGTAAGGQLD